MVWIKGYFLQRPLNVMQTHRYVTGVDTTRPAFMLSYDPAEVVAERLRARQYDSVAIPDTMDPASNFSPSGRSTSPWNALITPDGKVRVRWAPDNAGTLYPALDRRALSGGPVKSFALFTGEAHLLSSHSGGSVVRGSLAVSQRSAKGVLIYLVGTVGSKGSGADLELEDIENWRPGRPIYLPGDELDLPFRIVRGMGLGAVEAAGLERDGPHGNIAVPGLNGLTNASFSASANSAGAYRAFTGYQGIRKTRTSASSSAVNEQWSYETDYIGRSDGRRMVDHWLQVDFGQVVSNLSGTCLRSAPYNRFDRVEYTPRSPYRYRVQTSLDGETFEDQALVDAAPVDTSLVKFENPVSARFVRFAFETLHSTESGDVWITVCVAEVHQADA